ncbi:DUF2069 domain-containing protein [Leeia sp. TBRC 13508]|uniref:DUF2069 domain-containing protein n=1 Tax=Leeia speluncae TaxID=2884804 RepID=A0ABS8D3T7_9NEIS|nr:DUF2069 domain-containing protein [Leeia speluncae]MCB6182837.1 DUF2069 domain-containing protein [Leeia speluncae]
MRIAYYLTNAGLFGLILLCLLWELWLAPIKPGGSLLVLKALPLLFPLRGLLKGSLYTHKWMTMFILMYFTEGVMRAWSDKGLSQILAGIEVFLCVLVYIASIMFIRKVREARKQQLAA